MERINCLHLQEELPTPKATYLQETLKKLIHRLHSDDEIKKIKNEKKKKKKTEK